MNKYFIIEKIECMGDVGYILFHQVGLNKYKEYTSFDIDVFRDVYFAILKHNKTTQETIGIEYVAYKSSSIYYEPKGVE